MIALGVLLLDGPFARVGMDAGDPVRPWGEEYRQRARKRVLVLSPIERAGTTLLASLWASGPDLDAWLEEILAAQRAAGVLVAHLPTVAREDGSLAVPGVDASPSVAALWPASWRARLPGDGPEWVGDDPATLAPGTPPTGEPILLETLA